MTSDDPMPTADRAVALVLGAYLRYLRILRGWSQTDAALALGCSFSTVSRLEQGVVFTPRHARALFHRHYGVPKDLARAVDHLLSVTNLSTQAGDIGPGWHDRLALCEQQATAIATYTATVVPAPLRILAYKRALVPSGVSPYSAPHRIPRQLADRQVYTLFLDSSLLERPVGGARVMAQQLDHLLRLSWKGRIAIRVVPTAAGAPVGDAFLSRLTLQGNWLYVRESLGVVYTPGVPVFASRDRLFEAVAAAALPVDQSHRLLVQARERWRAQEQSHDMRPAVP
ncbi:Scr1 family TA system antitoxin-like transcriptional regulator [Streptomyces sp. NPDC021100]|uniref:Scr1 family TA system antitoxin-like transcriptional regulator n=1 Tax=Streptomyces sp. NPDC021100 TaxID=3365114 RepID=UPI00378BAAC9